MPRRRRSPGAPTAADWRRDPARKCTVWAVNGTLLRSTELSCPAPAAMVWTAADELALGSDQGLHLWNQHDTSVKNRSAPANSVWRILKTADAVLALAVSRQSRLAALGTSQGILLVSIDANDTTWTLLKS